MSRPLKRAAIAVLMLLSLTGVYGHAQSWKEAATIPLSGTVVGQVAIADVDNDGNADIIANVDHSVLYYRGDGKGSFAKAPIALFQDVASFAAAPFTLQKTTDFAVIE